MDASSTDILLQALTRLDQTLEEAVRQERTAHPDTEHEEYRGLYIIREDVERLLEQQPLAHTFSTGQQEFVVSSAATSLAHFMHCFSLSAFDMDVLLVALALEIDLRYERIYAYLQDDVSRKRPGVDLVLKLLCTSARERLARYRHFGPEGPLIKHGLVHLVPDSHQIEPVLLAHYIKIDEYIVRFLLDDCGPDPRLALYCRSYQATSSDEHQDHSSAGQMLTSLAKLVQQGRDDALPVNLYFHGPAENGQREMARRLAQQLRVPLLEVQVQRLAAESSALFLSTLALLLREACLKQAMLFFDDIDILIKPEQSVLWRQLLEALAEQSGIHILCGSETWRSTTALPMGVLPVPFLLPDVAARTTHWQREAQRRQLTLAEDDWDALGSRFQLTLTQIEQALTTACNEQRWQLARNGDHTHRHPARADLFQAARAQTGYEIALLAHKISVTLTWDDLVLPAEQMQQLQDLCDQARLKHVVYDQWGFAGKRAPGRDLNALFSGPPGTGKTMAASIIAASLGLDLYKIDLSQVVSKYIGETEKNLQRIFLAAERSNAVLFFDEADALFGKRSQVKDAHDRYANIEIGYLLQQMEEYDGVALLATNLRANMDDAFLRRLKCSIEFPFPDEPTRLLIWRDFFPAEAPVNNDIDFPFLARQFKLAGGNIKNIVLNASFLAAAQNDAISMRHIILAAHREFQKMGKMSLETEFGQYYRMVKEYARRS